MQSLLCSKNDQLKIFIITFVKLTTGKLFPFNTAMFWVFCFVLFLKKNINAFRRNTTSVMVFVTVNILSLTSHIIIVIIISLFSKFLTVYTILSTQQHQAAKSTETGRVVTLKKYPHNIVRQGD